MSLSMTERLERAIAKKPMTKAQLALKFPTIKNIYATIYDLDRRGYDVKRTKVAGEPVKYSL